MSNIALKQVYFEGITMQVPEIWETETEVFDEADGTKSYSLSINATGKDVHDLILHVHDTVKEKTGVDLLIEQEFVDWE